MSDNPFEEDQNTYPSAPAQNYNQNNNYNAQTYIADLNTPFNMSEEGLKQKELELNRREEDIMRRERSLYTQEQQIKKGDRVNNWPRCKPIIYHNIVGDMPTPETVALVRKAYGGFYAFIVCVLWNIVALLAALFSSSSGSAIASLLIGIAYALFVTPLFFLTYRTLYNACRKTKSALFFVWFIFIWMSIVIWLWFAIGVGGWGGGGLIIAIQLFNDNQTVAGIFCIVGMAVWAALAVWHIFVFFLARRHYKTAGGLQKAKQEMGETSGKVLASSADKKNPLYV